MTLTSKRLIVRPSAGEGAEPDLIPVSVSQYCAALERASPTHLVTTDDPEQDTARVHQSAVLKGARVDPALFGLTVTLEPIDYHSVDPENPRVWSSDPNRRGVLYEARLDSGGTFPFSVAPESRSSSIS
jgi:hypothetical protein